MGTKIHIDSTPIRKISGLIQAQLRLPNVDPSEEIGIVISFNEGKNHLAVSGSFLDVVNPAGDPFIDYSNPDIRPLIAPSVGEEVFQALNTKYGLADISPQRLRDEFLGTYRILFGGRFLNGEDGGFSRNSGPQLVATIRLFTPSANVVPARLILWHR